MKFGPSWDRGWRLVVRRIYQVFVGPKPSVHLHSEDEITHWLPILDPFTKWQRPITDSKYHLDKLGVDLIWLKWTLCLHWIDQ